ncbi:MAG: enoyl-CoA hydratase/isomerase family protein [Comamonadaceae bacterium]|jgi:enoyl-CoA hydratase/carnithine racemase|nr:enoyl-CoA hydratase/isomerase family protein [Comamonadaceae bacterium]
MSSAGEPVLMTLREKVAQVTLNRPEVGNAFNDAVRQGLPDLLEQLDRDPQCAVIVLHGAGERGFCVGADIKESRLIGTSVQERRRLLDNAWIDRVARISKPVIGALHGYCLGGGLELALACDIRMAARGTVFGLPETGLGLIPGGGGTQRLPRLVGLGRALDMMLSGDRVDAEQALAMGLVSRLCDDPNGLLTQAQALANRIAARPPTATAYAKEAAKSGMEMELLAGLTLEKTLFSLLMATEDRAEAALAFKEKRAPRFTGS